MSDAPARRVRIRKPSGWTEQPFICLSVSCGRSYHEGTDFRAVLAAVAASGKPLIVDLSDTLQAHNLVAVGMNLGAARALARERGTGWIVRNGAAVAGASGAIVRWDEWRTDPEFAGVERALTGLYTRSGVFAAAVDRDVRTFLGRRGEAAPLMAACSWQFILEDAAGEILLARRYPCARLYPGRELTTLAALRNGEIPGAPSGLERSRYYRLTRLPAARRMSGAYKLVTLRSPATVASRLDGRRRTGLL